MTGSRILRDEFSSASPIAIITSEKAALAGLLEASDILQNSTIATGQQIDDTFSGFVTDGGPGARSVSLRGLGEQRTLVLVNGKRWGPSGIGGGTNSVDLSAVPESSIARYEILKDGASSIYGADAVAGVVNAITVNRFDGLLVNVERFMPESKGGEFFVADATWGRVGSDWSLSVSGGFSQREDMVRKQRHWASCDRRQRFTDQDGDSTIDNTNPETGEPLCFGDIYGFLAFTPFGWLRYEPSLGELNQSNPYYSRPQEFGIPYFTTVPVHGWDPTSDPNDPEPLWDNEGPFYIDTRNSAIEDIVSEQRRLMLTSFGDKDFTIGGRSANAYYEFYYNQRSTIYTPSSGQFFPTVPATNPTNPLGNYGPLAQFGGFSVTPVISRRELYDPDTDIEIDRYNVFFGLKGDLSARWSYDAYIGYNHSNGTLKDWQLLDDRVVASLNATLDANGNLVCVEPTIAGCVPANLFTEDALLHGRLPQDVLNFIAKYTAQETTYSGYQLSAYATGPLFSMPNGQEVNLVVGLETRKEKINDVPDPDAQANNFWGFATAGITVGDDTVRELFMEIEVPLLDGPRYGDLVFNGAARWTDYDSYGGDNTYRMMLDYQITPQLRFRGTSGTSFRAPDLFEQYQGNQQGFVSPFIDPCINYGETYEPEDIVYLNCQAEGLEPTHGSEGAPGIMTIVGGNRDLLAEASQAWTTGFVIQPDQLGFSVALTWYEIEVKNTISDVSVSYVLDACYGSPGRGHAFCRRVGGRDENGFLSSVDSSRLNIGRQMTRGVDIDFIFERSFPSFDLTIDGTIARLQDQETELFDEQWNSVGHWGYPKWTGVLDIVVDYRDLQLFWRADYMGKTSEDEVYDPGTTTVDRVHWTNAHWEHTLSVRWSNLDWTVVGTIRNLFNKMPPLVADGVPRDATSRFFNTLPGVGYDIFGRAFVLQVARNF